MWNLVHLTTDNDDWTDILQTTIKTFTDEKVWQSLPCYTAASNNLQLAWHNVLCFILKLT